MGAAAGSGPHTDPCGSLGGLGAGCQPRGLAAPGCLSRGSARGGCQRVGRCRAAAARLRSSAHHPLACVRLGSPAPVPGLQGYGLQQPVRSATRTVHAPAAGPEPRASRKPQATPRRACARECCGHGLAVPPRAHRPCPTPYRSCSPVTRTSAMRSSSLCCAPPLPLGLLSLPPLPALPPSMLGAVPLHCLCWPPWVWMLNQPALTAASPSMIVTGNPVAQTRLAGEEIPVGWVG